MSQQPNPEIQPQASRRRFSASYETRIVQEATRCKQGEGGALLRREG